MDQEDDSSSAKTGIAEASEHTPNMTASLSPSADAQQQSPDPAQAKGRADHSCSTELLDSWSIVAFWSLHSRRARVRAKLMHEKHIIMVAVNREITTAAVVFTNRRLILSLDTVDFLFGRQ